LTEAALSPEQFGRRMEVSGMTLRRFLKRPDGEEIPEAYAYLFRQGVYRLIIEGLLPARSKAAKVVVSERPSLSFDAAIRGLGFRRDAMALGASHEDKVLIGLTEIGADVERQGEVRQSGKTLSRFRALGREWAHRVNTLRKVIASRKLTQLEKLSAYGALFYLITTFDLIPDTIPVFGMLDDFSILGIVVAYYVHKFPELFDVNPGS
jgi:uncharacterized membrane protein YkvA (DUF1232 family)